MMPTSISDSFGSAAALHTSHVPVQVGTSASDDDIWRDLVESCNKLAIPYTKPTHARRKKGDRRCSACRWYLLKGSPSPVYRSINGNDYIGVEAARNALDDWAVIAWPTAVYSAFKRDSAAECADTASLEAWGVPKLIVDSYARLGVSALHDWQRNVLLNDRCAALRGCNVVYCAPTGGGKTLVAEVIMLRHLLTRGKKVIFVVPFVSLCLEKAKHLEAVLAPLSFRVVALYQDKGVPSLAGVDVAVATIERANSLVNRLAIAGKLNEVGCVVIDEIHMISEGMRGSTVELLVMKLLAHCPRRHLHGSPRVRFGSAPAPITYASMAEDIQIVGMSATFPNVHDLAEWMHGTVYVEEARLVPLHEYVCISGILYDRDFRALRLLNPKWPRDGDMWVSVVQYPTDYRLPGDGPACNAPLIMEDGHVFLNARLEPGTLPKGDSLPILVALCMESISISRNVIVFVRTPTDAVRRACAVREFITSKLPFAEYQSKLEVQPLGIPILCLILQKDRDSREKCVEGLRYTPGGIDAELRACLLLGIAFHHAGLTIEERILVEQAFRDGLIFAIFATTTLGTGVNLPAGRVIFDGIHDASDGGLISEGKYRQMSGRAGRFGLDDFGESVILVNRLEGLARPGSCEPFFDQHLTAAHTSKGIGDGVAVDPALITGKTAYYEPFALRPSLRSVRMWLQSSGDPSTNLKRPANMHDGIPRKYSHQPPLSDKLSVSTSTARNTISSVSCAEASTRTAERGRGSINIIEWIGRLLHYNQALLRSSMLTACGKSSASSSAPSDLEGVLPLRRAILELVCCNFADSHRNYALQHINQLSFFAKHLPDAILRARLSESMEYLISHEFVFSCGGTGCCKYDLTPSSIASTGDALPCIHPTQLGRGAFLSAIAPEDALDTVAEVTDAQSKGLCVGMDDLHSCYLLAPAENLILSQKHWSILQSHLTSRAVGSQELAERLELTPLYCSDKADTMRTAPSRVMPNKADRRYIRFFVALITTMLIREVPIDVIAHRMGVHRGKVQQLQMAVTMRAQMVCTLLKELNWHLIYYILKDLAKRVEFGVDPELFFLMSVPGVSALKARALFKAGFRSMEDLANAEVASVQAALLSNVPFRMSRVDSTGAVVEEVTTTETDLFRPISDAQAFALSEAIIANAKVSIAGAEPDGAGKYIS